MDRPNFIHRRRPVASACTVSEHAISSFLTDFGDSLWRIKEPGQEIYLGADKQVSEVKDSYRVQVGELSGHVGNPGSHSAQRDWFLSLAVNPILKEVEFSERMEYFRGLVVTETLRKKQKIIALLCYEQCAVEYEYEEDLSFQKWLEAFQPLNRYDYAMALDLYFSSRDFGERVPTIKPTQDPWLNAFLKDTRGFLLWRHQFIEVIKILSALSGKKLAMKAEDIVTALNKKEASSVMEAEDILAKIRYPDTGQTLLEIVNERSHRRRHWGEPDYVSADWLLQYRSKAWDTASAMNSFAKN